VWYIRGLNWQMDRVTYSVNVAYGIKGALRSIFFWLVPFGTHSWRFYPGFTVLVFVFHICLLVTPVFLMGHNVLLLERWGFSLPTLPEGLADMMTLAVIVAAVFIILRRIALPEVRILTKPYDFLVLAIAVAPFLTGFLAYHQVGKLRLLDRGPRVGRRDHAGGHPLYQAVPLSAFFPLPGTTGHGLRRQARRHEKQGNGLVGLAIY
jgi:hypothetical protein